ncbi:hypothetical protein CYMTET_21195 [Cymbomonas tetramitiformis]|uniref:RecQ-mediated genome instability protein 2 n=1 Tax=Cymbomonas tetramitiformis TaxID=36881 RepID=A0AAE0L3E7_9CHLO|nr:hypothetical protein CYMTET_21195 [Cymbomonas tetramitiformis]
MPPKNDWSLRSAKLFIAHFNSAVCDQRAKLRGKTVWKLSPSLEFERVWIQGVVVQLLPGNEFLIDDGTGVCTVDVRQFQKKVQNFVVKLGMYLFVIGPLHLNSERQYSFSVKAHKIQDLSNDPDRESMWYLEVLDLHTSVYQCDSHLVRLETSS